jgi:putative MFS transporter
MAVTGFAWTFVAMEILLISFVVFIAFEKGDPLFRPNEFVDTALLSSTLIGSLLGSVVIGRLSDRTGRQRLFQASILWYSVFTALAALSPNWETLFSLRVLAGLGLGGMLVVDPALLSEYLPPQSRGRYLVVLDFFWPLGFLVAIGLAFVFLNLMNNDWRLLFLAAAFPAFLAFVFRATIPESPYFLARSGRKEDAARVLSRVTGRTVDPAALAGVEVGPRPSVGALFRTKHVRASVVTIVVWIGLNFSYYGLFLWMPFVLAANRGFAPGDLYQLLFLSALAQLPGYLTSAYLVEKWGRRSTLAMFLVLGGLSGYVFATAQDFGSFLFGLFFVSFFNLGAWGAVYPYTAELFPTEFRSTAFGLAEGVGKITAVLSPFIFGVLLVAGAQDVLWPLTAIALSMVVGGAVAAVVGRETKGQPFH